MKLDPYLTQCTKVNSKWLIDLCVRAKTIKPLEENLVINLCDLGLSNGFLTVTRKAQATEEKSR